MAFDYDVFVSYSSADREWAIRLNDLLTAPGSARTTFFDRASLRAGDDWEERIEAGLASSKHLVVLWSDAAKDSQWVQLEIATFRIHAKPKVNPHRRQIFINLGGQNKTSWNLHQIVLPALQDAYLAETPEANGIWHDVGVAVTAGLDPAGHPLEVPLVVMTLTRDQFDAYPAAERRSLAAAFNATSEQLADGYGPTRDQWQPLAGSKTVVALLTDVKRDIETAMGGRQLVWKQPAPAFWSDVQVAEDYVENVFLKQDLALLIIDPVALHDRETLSRLNRFRDCFERPQSVIVVLPPCDVPIFDGLKRRLRDSAMLYLDEYFKPRIPPRHHLVAQCAWNAGDADDILRHMLLAAGRSLPNPSPASVYTSPGAAR